MNVHSQLLRLVLRAIVISKDRLVLKLGREREAIP